MLRPHFIRAERVIDRVDVVLMATVLVLAGATVTMIAIPSLRARIVAPALDLTLDSVALVVMVSVAVLAWVRYRERRESFALFQSAAFLVLAIANIRAIVETVGPDIRSPLSVSEPGQGQLFVFTAACVMTAILLIVGGLASLNGRQPGHPLLIVIAPATLLVGVMVWVESAGASLPALVAISGPSSGQLAQAPAVTSIGVVIQLFGAMLFGAAAIVSRRLWRRDRAIGDAYVTVGLVLVAFALIHGAVSPSTHPGPVASGDLLRLAFYIVLLLAIEAEAGSILTKLRSANRTLELLRESEVARAALEERAWLSRELHDGLAQDLWLAKLKVGRLAGLDLSSEARSVADELSGAIELGLAEARQAVMALRIAAESEDPFPELMSRYVDDFQDRFGLRVEFECGTDLPPMPVRTQAELLRIAQEALTNARHHADATVVRVQATVTGGRIRLSITDNGRGFDLAGVRKNAFGLAAMRERAALIGADLEVRSSPGDGTQIVVIAPLDIAIPTTTLEST